MWKKLVAYLVGNGTETYILMENAINRKFKAPFLTKLKE